VLRATGKGGTLVAVFLAAAAFMAASAHGALTFTSGSSSGLIAGTQTTEHVLTLPLVLPNWAKGELKCATVTETAALSSTSFTELEVAPSYSECRYLGYINGSILMNGCKYRFKGATASTATMSIVCPTGKEVTIVVGNGFCIVHIPPQMLGYVSFANNSSGQPDDVTRTYSVTGLGYVATQGCTENEPAGGRNNGTLTGSSTLQALNLFSTPVSLTVD
jgi:hypothetical protein